MTLKSISGVQAGKKTKVLSNVMGDLLFLEACWVNSVGPTTGNGFDPRKHFPSKRGPMSREGSWLSVNHHIQTF